MCFVIVRFVITGADVHDGVSDDSDLLNFQLAIFPIVGKISLAGSLGLLNTPRIRLKNGKIRMATGTLKMWNAERGYGFIGDDAGGPDVFLHVSALQSSGIDPDNIRKGERLSFDVESTREGKTRASNVRRPG